MEKRFEVGDLVAAKVRPLVPLVIRLYARRVYYCNVMEDPSAREQVYFDRELMPYAGDP